MRLILVTGGARSGKSRYAEARARELCGDGVTYIATAKPSDEEMVHRIAVHRAHRPRSWFTIEAPLHIGQAITATRTPTIIVDCITLLTANALESAAPACEAQAIDAMLAQATDLLAAARCRPDGALIMVTNEVGLAVHPPTCLGRWFQDGLGQVNQRLAAVSDEVVLMVAGLPIVLKAAKTQ